MNLSGRIIYYTGKITKQNRNEFRLETPWHKGQHALTLKKSGIIYAKEIPEPEREDKVFKIFSKKKFKNLKPGEEPEF